MYSVSYTKVIKGLKCCRDGCPANKADCPYFNPKKRWACETTLLNEAYVLLNEIFEEDKEE